MMSLWCTGCVVFVLSAGWMRLFLWGWMRWAPGKGWVDVPNERSSHQRALPRGGGLGWVCAVSFVFVVVGLGGLASARQVMSLLIPGVLLASVSLADDHSGINPWLRLSVQALAVTLCLVMMGPLSTLELGGWRLNLGVWAYPFSGLCLLWSINLFNFLDGLDGLAATQGLCLFAVMSFMLGVAHLAWLMMVTCAMAGCLAVFLWDNWPPAKVFMGDVGSCTCGFFVTAMAMSCAHQPQASQTLVWMWPMLMSWFIADATFTLLRRWRQGCSLFEPHLEHAFHRLHRCGYSVQRVLGYFMGWLAVSVCCVLLLWQHPAWGGVIVLTLLCMGVLAYGVVMRITTSSGRL